MIRVFQRNTVHKTVLAGSDMVIAYAPIPANGRVNNLWVDVHIINWAQVSLITAHMYTVNGYVVPVIDPDAGISPQLLWDQVVPKAAITAAGSVDFDTTTPDLDPVMDPGEVNWNSLFEVNQAPFEFFKRERVMSYAVSKGGHLEGSPDVYRPTDHFSAQVGKRMQVKVPSYAMLAVGSPSMANNRTVFVVPDSPADWAQLQYIEDVLERGLMHMVGLTEAGAETPWLEAATLLSQLLENGEEDSAGAWLTTRWEVFCKATWDVSYEGRMKIGPITSR